ncbi:MAG: hypothetical protein FJ042_05625 [Candidatus Cloacimonetes bacterium]|nr:hypothetical protein [Candidatus Cloacimonadota bacterium]
MQWSYLSSRSVIFSSAKRFGAHSFGRGVVFLLAILLFTLSSPGAIAALGDYSFSSELGSYQEINGGTVFGSQTTDNQYFVNTTNLSGGTTTTGSGIPIGFDFVFSGIRYDLIGINANGWISLGQSAMTPAVNMTSTNAYQPLDNTPTTDSGILIARIAGFADNLQAQSNASIRMQTVGEAPNRIGIVQWKGYRIFNLNNNNFNFQIQLHESTNKIRIAYGTFSFIEGVSDRYVQVGLRGHPSGTASNFSTRFSDSGHTIAWQNTSPGVTASANVRFRQFTRPANGLIFTFSPPPPNPPQPVTSLAIVGSPEGLVLQWDPALYADLYQICSTDDPYGDDWDIEAVIDGTNWIILGDHRSKFYRIISIQSD